MIAENTKRNEEIGQEDSDNEGEEGEGEGEESGDEKDDEEEEEEEADSDDDFSDLIYESDSEEERLANDSSKKDKLQNGNRSLADNLLKLKENGVANKPMTDEERKAMIEKASKELPYTFELPEKYDALEKLLRKRNAEYQSIIIERMIKCNHPKVEPANKEKMVELFAYLLQHVNDTAAAAIVRTAEQTFSIVDQITPFLYDLSHINAAETTKCFLEVIKEKQADYRAQEKQYPTLDTLVFFKMASDLYSTSDFRHTVVTPTIIFISQLLARCRVADRKDIASGLFLITCILDYTKMSNRFLPAALNFLNGVIYLCVRKRPIQQLKVIPPFKSVGIQNSLLVLSGEESPEVLTRMCKNDKLLRSTDLVDTSIDESFKVRALHTTLLMACNALEMLVENTGAKFFAAPLENIIGRLDCTEYPGFIKEAVTKCQKLIDSIGDQNLSYLVPGVKKPKQLRMLEPKIERIFDDKRNRKPGQREKGVRDGMIQKIRRETKGAIREIRRDNAFLAKIQLKRQMHRYDILECAGGKRKTNNLLNFSAMRNEERKSNESSLRLPFSKENSTQWIARRNICRTVLQEIPNGDSLTIDAHAEVRCAHSSSEQLEFVQIGYYFLMVL